MKISNNSNDGDQKLGKTTQKQGRSSIGQEVVADLYPPVYVVVQAGTIKDVAEPGRYRVNFSPDRS